MQTKTNWIVTILTAVVAALSIVLQAINPTPTQTATQIRQAATPVVQKQATKVATAATTRAVLGAANAAANTPAPANQACNVPAGQGVMGACAPKPVALLSMARALSSSVTTIRNHPIGTDTSSYQGCVAPPSWVSFWIIKATEGTGYTDRCVGVDTRIAHARHLVLGWYDFMRATGTNAYAEASHYISTVRAVGGGTSGLHVLDVEAGTLSSSVLHAYVCDWASRVHAAFGDTIVVYTGGWFWVPRVGGNNCGTVLWVSAYASYAVVPAAWGGGTLTPSSAYRPFAPFWQYSDGVYGPYPRVNGWDTDVYFGTKAQLEQLAGEAKPCSQRTACRMGRRHAHVHLTIDRKCHGAPAASHRKICRELRGRNRYMHRYRRAHHIGLFVTR